MTVPALARQPSGLRRLPVVTAVVFVVTATTSLLGLVVPGVLEALERTPQGLRGDWVADGHGAVGAGRRCRRDPLQPGLPAGRGRLGGGGPGGWQWLVCYFGAGLVGELAGYAWQPRGAGNSVAICGLAGAVVVQVALGRSLLAGPPVAAAAAMVALVLLAAMDLHGAAMAAGIVIAALIGRQAASPRPEARLGAERWPPCQGRRGRSSQEERFVSCRVCRLRR